MQNFKFKQGQKVSFLADGNAKLSGIAEIVGVATTELPVIGHSYIIRPTLFTGDIKIPNDEYPFECFAIPEIHLKAIN